MNHATRLIAISAAAAFIALGAAAPAIAETPISEWGFSHRDTVIYLGPGGVADAPNTLVPRFGRFRLPRGNPDGHSSTIDIPVPQPHHDGPSVLSLPAELNRAD